MNVSADHVGESQVTELLVDIRTRAQLTPSLPAVRFDGCMVTYGDLGAAVDSFETVTQRHGLAGGASLYAAVLHTLPALADLDDAVEQGVVLDQVISWLGRHLPPSATPLQAAG